MNFNTVSTLLGVSSVHDTVLIFKLGGGKKSEMGNGKLPSPSPSSDSVDTVKGGVDEGYEAFIEKKKRSMQVTKALLHSMCICRILLRRCGNRQGILRFRGFQIVVRGVRWRWVGAYKTSFSVLSLVDPFLHSTMSQVMVKPSEGTYDVDLENEGECSLMKYRCFSYSPFPSFVYS